jgi:hypothetical protein
MNKFEKYNIEVPNTVEQAHALDEENGNIVKGKDRGDRV